jgi:hypothetical protein
MTVVYRKSFLFRNNSILRFYWQHLGYGREGVGNDMETLASEKGASILSCCRFWWTENTSRRRPAIFRTLTTSRRSVAPWWSLRRMHVARCDIPNFYNSQHRASNFVIWKFWLNYCEPTIKLWSICLQFQNKCLFPGNNPWISLHSLDYNHFWAEV